MPYGVVKNHCSDNSPAFARYNAWFIETRGLQLPRVTIKYDPLLSVKERERNTLAQPWYQIIDIATSRRVGSLYLSIDTDGTYASLDTSNPKETLKDNTGTIGNITTKDPLCKGAGRAAMCLAFEMLSNSNRQAFVHLFTHEGYKVGCEMIGSEILHVRTPFADQADGLFHGYAVFQPQTIHHNMR